jgi:beta-galactosidase/beta-glucuronidase
MYCRLFFSIFSILFLVTPGSLTAQENQEPPHAWYHLTGEREITIPLLQSGEGNALCSCVFDSVPGWTGKQVFVRIAGSEIPYSIRINGFRFGSDPGINVPAEYNITPFLNSTGNSIELTYEPPQSVARMDSGGCCPPVTLLIRDAIHVRDLVVTAFQGPENDQWLIRFHLFIKSYLTGKNMGRDIALMVTDPDGERIITGSGELGFPLSYGQETELIIDRTMKDARLWSPASPLLYGLQLEISEKGNAEPETITTNFGIRSFGWSDSVMILNGEPLRPVVARDEQATMLVALPAPEAIKFIRDHGINLLFCDDTLPVGLVQMFDQNGVVVIRKRGQMNARTDQPLINCPSVIWVD